MFRRKRDRTIDPDERAPQTGIKAKDLAVLHALIGAGADLTQPRHVIHYLYFGSQEAAMAAAVDAGAESFDCDVRDPLTGNDGRWSLVCERHGAVLDPVTVRETGDFFDALAGRHSGEYDGWEASV